MDDLRRLTIATICARGGSKGLLRKNLRPFAGKPLIAHTIEQARACSLIDAVYVSTEDEEIAAVARDWGAKVPYRRPAELATDTAAKIPAIEHLVAFLEGRGERIGLVVDLQPTSPLRTQEDLAQAIRLAPRADLVVSVAEPSHSPYFSLVEEQADGTVRLSKSATFVRRQEVPAAWGLNGSIYVWQRAALARAAVEGFWSVRVLPSVMPRERSVDIDDALDFEWAEWLWRRHQAGGQP